VTAARSTATTPGGYIESVTEAALDPGLPICDPHHHLWDHPGSRYLLEELRADTGSGHNVQTTVFVECGSAWRTDGPEPYRPVGETAFVAAEAARSASSAAAGSVIGAIVGYADLRVPAIEEVLAAHVDAGRGRFRGIRQVASRDESPDFHVSHTNPPAHLLADPAFRSGLVALGRAGHSFDAYLYHPQLPELTAAARAAPDTMIVLDHLGAPIGVGPYEGRRAEVLEVWRRGMAELAGCENVVLKLGGIGMPIFGLEWHRREVPPDSEELANAWGTEISWCIDRFGVERCMFESNFPVDKQSCSYLVLWNAFKRIVAGASPGEKAALFHDNAMRVYRIPSAGDRPGEAD
jgi:predicted TIM-barrel fold metal-dependent hydrolase